jgi:hypothetical protein
MIVGDECGAVGGMRICRETEVLGENLPQCHFVYHKSHMTWPRLEPGPPRWEAGLSYGAATHYSLWSWTLYYVCRFPFRRSVTFTMWKVKHIVQYSHDVYGLCDMRELPLPLLKYKRHIWNLAVDTSEVKSPRCIVFSEGLITERVISSLEACSGCAQSWLGYFVIFLRFSR